MIKTIDIITLLKARYNCVSNRDLAKKIGLSHSTINLCFKGHSLSIDNALAFADELELDRNQVLIGNLCEKRLVSQQARDMLLGLIGEKYQPKTDRLTYVLAHLNKDATTQTAA